MSNATTEKYNAILEVALRLISEHGFHGTPMSLVAQEAQVGVGTIYRYFDSKEALINSLYRHYKAAVTQAMLAGLGGDGPLRARFRRAWLNLAHYYLDHPEVFKFVEQYSYSPFITAESRSESAEQLAPMRAFLQHGQEQEILKDISFEVVNALLYGTISALVRRQVYGEQAVSAVMLDQAVEACWDALKR